MAAAECSNDNRAGPRGYHSACTRILGNHTRDKHPLGVPCWDAEGCSADQSDDNKTYQLHY